MVRETPVETPRRPEPLPWPAVIAVATAAAALVLFGALRAFLWARGSLAFDGDRRLVWHPEWYFPFLVILALFNVGAERSYGAKRGAVAIAATPPWVRFGSEASMHAAWRLVQWLAILSVLALWTSFYFLFRALFDAAWSRSGPGTILAVMPVLFFFAAPILLYAVVALGRRGDSKAAGILAFAVPVVAGGMVMMLVAAI
jgi:hypothetical protein